MSKPLAGHLFALITIAIWSSTFIVTRLLLVQLTPLQILFSRFSLAIIFLSLIMPTFKKPVSVKSELLFVAVGTALALYFVFENSALQFTYTSNVSLIVATIPLLTGFIAMIFLKNPFFGLKNVVGFLTAYLGVFLIIMNGRQFDGVSPLGDMLALAAAVMFAIYAVLMQKITGHYHMIQLTRKVFFYAWLVIGAALLITGQSPGFSIIDGKLAAGLLFLGIVASSLAFILWNKAIRIVGPVKTSQYIYLIPVFTTVMSVLVFAEKITVITVVGTVFILSGLYITQKRAKV